MAVSYGILAVLPPLIAFVLVIWKKQLIPALLIGVYAGKIIIAKGHVGKAFLASQDNLIAMIGNKSNLQIILFSLLVGGLLNMIKEAKGFQGFLNWCKSRTSLNTEKSAYPLTYVLNLALFIDSWSSILITGTLMRSIYTKFGISRERLAYFLHTIALNFCALVVFNSWGAYYLSVLSTQNIESPQKIIIQSIPLNFYCLGSLVFVAIVMITKLTIGPMRKCEIRAQENKRVGGDRSMIETDDSAGRGAVTPRAIHLILPIVTLVFFMFLGLYLSGKGSIIKGAGSESVFNAVCITIGLTVFLFKIKKLMNFEQMISSLFKGMADLLPIAVLLALSFTIGDVCKQVGTGEYLSMIVKENLPGFVVPAIVFGISCLISFATGTSWGTIAIMIPIAMPIAFNMQINPALMFAVCIGGGLFGDNCSPLSDTSILTGMVAEVPIIDHVKTQIPYALIVASVSISLYLLMGALGA